MTPFMLRVADLVEGEAAPSVGTEASEVRPIAAGADHQMMVRALAEQLVSEANAVLRESGDVIDLVDDSAPGELAFTLTYLDRTVRVQTLLAGRTALGRLSAPGVPDGESRQLTSEGEVEAVLLQLLAVPVPR